MLVDAKHKPWAVATVLLGGGAAAVYVPYHLDAPNGPSGGSWTGLGFGLAAFLLMAFAGLLGARRKVPTWRIGRPETWMRAHLWLGLLLVPLVFFHAGFQFGGALTATLIVLLVLVTLSGLLGLVLQQILPRMITSRVPMETIYEQIEHVLAQLREEADLVVANVAGPLVFPAAAAGSSVEARTVSGSIKAPLEGSVPLREFHLKQVRPFLESEGRAGPLAVEASAAAAFAATRKLLPPPMHEALHDLEVMCEERRQLARQRRLHRWLHGWLLVHVPLSYALLLLSAVHAFQSLRY
jgi:hypothetical protein